MQTGPDAVRLLELEKAAEEVKLNALISALSIILLKEINVCNGQLNAAASSFEAMQTSVPLSLHKKVKGFVTLVRADIQHLNRAEPVQFLSLTADQSAVLLSLSKPPLSNASEAAAKEQAASVMLNRLAQAQELLGSQMEIFLKATSAAPRLAESPPLSILPTPKKPKIQPYADFTKDSDIKVKLEAASSMREPSAPSSLPPNAEQVVYFTQEILLRALTEKPPSLADIKIGTPLSSNLPYYYAEGSPMARFQFSLYLNTFAHTIPVLHMNDILQVFVMHVAPSAPLLFPQPDSSLSPLSLDFSSTSVIASDHSSPDAELKKEHEDLDEVFSSYNPSSPEYSGDEEGGSTIGSIGTISVVEAPLNEAPLNLKGMESATKIFPRPPEGAASQAPDEDYSSAYEAIYKFNSPAVANEIISKIIMAGKGASQPSSVPTLAPSQPSFTPPPPHKHFSRWFLPSSPSLSEMAYLQDVAAPLESRLNPSRQAIGKIVTWKYDGALTENPQLDRSDNCNVYNNATPRVLLGVTHGVAIGNGGAYIRMLNESVPPQALMVLNKPFESHYFYDEVTDACNSFTGYAQLLPATSNMPPRTAIWQIRHEEANRGDVYTRYHAGSIYINPDEPVVICPINQIQSEENMRPISSKRIPLTTAAGRCLVLDDITWYVKEAIERAKSTPNPLLPPESHQQKQPLSSSSRGIPSGNQSSRLAVTSRGIPSGNQSSRLAVTSRGKSGRGKGERPISRLREERPIDRNRDSSKEEWERNKRRNRGSDRN